MVDPLPMPRALVRAAEQEGRDAWLLTLPQTVHDLKDRWALTVGEPFQPGGSCAWVAPVRDSTGAELVLKVAWPHPEAEHEADGLREWAGEGAVRLHASAELEDATALLLERCIPGTAADSRPEPEQDVIVAGLLRRLWRRPAPGQRFRTLQSMCDMWADEFEHKPVAMKENLDPGLTREGLTLFRALPGTADEQVLLCTDLHAGNVLAADREPWLVIDPKPYVGDPTYDVLQHLLNCKARLVAEPRDLVGRMAGLAGVDKDRVGLWLFARCVVESIHWPDLREVARRLAPG